MTTYSERFDKNWKWVNEYFHRKTKEFKIVGWKLKVDSAKDRLAQTDYNERKITISKHFLRGPTCSEKQLRNTILHELAHVLTPGEGHNSKWKKKALSIGCDGKIYNYMDRPYAKWLIYCPKKCFKITEYNKTNNMLCGKCYSKIICKELK